MIFWGRGKRSFRLLQIFTKRCKHWGGRNIAFSDTKPSDNTWGVLEIDYWLQEIKASRAEEGKEPVLLLHSEGRGPPLHQWTSNTNKALCTVPDTAEGLNKQQLIHFHEQVELRDDLSACWVLATYMGCPVILLNKTVRQTSTSSFYRRGIWGLPGLASCQKLELKASSVHLQMLCFAYRTLSLLSEIWGRELTVIFGPLFSDSLFRYLQMKGMCSWSYLGSLCLEMTGHLKRLWPNVLLEGLRLRPHHERKGKFYLWAHWELSRPLGLCSAVQI